LTFLRAPFFLKVGCIVRDVAKEHGMPSNQVALNAMFEWADR